MSPNLRVWAPNKLLPVLDFAQVSLEMGAGLPIMHLKVDDFVDSARIISINKDSFPHIGTSFTLKKANFNQNEVVLVDIDTFPSILSYNNLFTRVLVCHLMSNKIDADLVFNWFNDF